MINYKTLWNKVIEDLNNDDIVLELKIFDTNVQNWIDVLNLIYANFYEKINQDKTSINLNKINNLNVNNFPISQNDVMEYIMLDFKDFNLTLTLYTIEEIEFFSNSIVKLKYNNVESLFSFCETVSNKLLKNIYIYCEGYNKYSVFYNPNNKFWKSYKL